LANSGPGELNAQGRLPMYGARVRIIPDGVGYLSRGNGGLLWATGSPNSAPPVRASLVADGRGFLRHGRIPYSFSRPTVATHLPYMGAA
jgi:hypothetical protein